MNNPAIKAVGAVFAVVLMVVLCFGLATSGTTPAHAESQNCVLDVQGAVALVVCGGEQIGQVPIPRVTVSVPPVTLPPITLPPVTLPPIKLPQVTEFVTIRPPQITVRDPALTQTVTETATETVIQPGETITRTQTVQPTPTETITEQSSPAPDRSRQDGGSDDTLPEDESDIDFTDDDITAEEVGIGLITLSGLIGLILLAMYGGYAIGYKDADKENATFMDSLLSRAKVNRGEHS